MARSTRHAQLGLGYIANSRIRAEFLYYGNWGRVAPDNALRYTENIWRVNIKIGLSHARLSHVWDPSEQ